MKHQVKSQIRLMATRILVNFRLYGAILLLFFACNQRDTDKVYCNLDFRKMEFSDSGCNKISKFEIWTNRQKNIESVQFKLRDSIISDQVLLRTRGSVFFIDRNLSMQNAISISGFLFGATRRFVFVEVTGKYILRYAQSFESDSSIKVVLPSALLEFTIDPSFDNIEEFFKSFLFSNPNNFSNSYYKIIYKYNDGVFLFKTIGYHPWIEQTENFDSILFATGSPYLDIKNIDPVFLDMYK